MYRSSNSNYKNKQEKHQLSEENDLKVLHSLINSVYLQANVALVASLFCATIVFAGLYEPAHTSLDLRLFIWAGMFLMITFLRLVVSAVYKFDTKAEKRAKFWSRLYTIGSMFGGFSWGLSGIILLPYVGGIQQTLLILMLSGVTAGAVPLSASIPTAAIAFLVGSILPFIVSILLMGNSTYLLFNLALSIYLVYTIILTMKAYKLIKNSIVLQFENNALLNILEVNNKKLAQAATHDPLTQIANRRLFLHRLNQSIMLAKHSKTIFALFYIDLDHFKEANDSAGHHVGDFILKMVVERVTKYFARNDLMARLGGDEFAIILDNVNHVDELEEVAQNLCIILAAPMKLNDMTIKISASIGIGVYPQDGSDEDTLLRSADKYMYIAKKRGGNTFYCNKEVETHA